jgi:PiT family inorganic phosphate transporter
VAYFVFPLKVAATIGKGTIDPSIVDHYVIFGALVGAVAWNFITWYFGIPSSSSHALIGGLVGAAWPRPVRERSSPRVLSRSLPSL